MMKRILPFLLVLTACTGIPQRELTLHYDRPATFFEDDGVAEPAHKSEA